MPRLYSIVCWNRPKPPPGVYFTASPHWKATLKRCIPRVGMYTYRSRGTLNMDTVFVVRLIETMTTLSVRKLGSLGSTSWSLPINAMFRMSLLFAFTRGACVGTAVICGFELVDSYSTTVGTLTVGARVAPLVGLAAIVAVAGRGVSDGAGVGGTATVLDGVRVGLTVAMTVGTAVGICVSACATCGARFVLVGGGPTGTDFVIVGGTVALGRTLAVDVSGAFWPVVAEVEVSAAPWACACAGACVATGV